MGDKGDAWSVHLDRLVLCFPATELVQGMGISVLSHTRQKSRGAYDRVTVRCGSRMTWQHPMGPWGSNVISILRQTVIKWILIFRWAVGPTEQRGPRFPVHPRSCHFYFPTHPRRVWYIINWLKYIFFLIKKIISCDLI